MTSMKKLAVIGLDCADPALVFDRIRDDLPALRGLLSQSEYGVLRSTVPPITIPAWICMFTGRDPGELGLYGFEHRYGHGYKDTQLASSALLRHPTAWDTLGEHGLNSIVIGVPMTYPPRPIRGALVTGILTPDESSAYTYPPSLKKQVEAWVGPYLYDVPDFRLQDRSRLIADVRRMTEQRFRLAAELAEKMPWDLLVVVEMGPDRMHHAFWADHDPTHPAHDPASPFRSAIHDYYAFLDEQIQSFIETVSPEAEVLVVSDHGAQAMRGGFCVNEWLIERGDLVLRSAPEQPTGIGTLIRSNCVDWPRTRAWGTGGYCGRIHLNVQGRQPDGALSDQDAASYLDDLTSALEAIPFSHGNRRLKTRTFRPAEAYKEVVGYPADLAVYFGDLAWRSIGSVERGQLRCAENDTGPDHANHRPEGLYIRSAHGAPGQGPEQNILCVQRWILEHFGL